MRRLAVWLPPQYDEGATRGSGDGDGDVDGEAEEAPVLPAIAGGAKQA